MFGTRTAAWLAILANGDGGRNGSEQVTDAFPDAVLARSLTRLRPSTSRA